MVRTVSNAVDAQERARAEQQHRITCTSCRQTSHPVEGCPAKGHRCAICGAYGLYATVCRGGSRKKSWRRRDPRRQGLPSTAAEAVPL